MRKKIATTLIATMCITTILAGCGKSSDSSSNTSSNNTTYDKEDIEELLNISNNDEVEWTYSSDSDAWVMSIVSSVVYPELEEQQGVSVAVPGAYVEGIDTDGDGKADATGDDAGDGISGNLVIDEDGSITNENGQTYTASTCPVIINTGAAGYSSQSNSLASTGYASYGYINVACGNRGKQDTVTDEDGNTTYTGDAPDCLVDQKNAVRFVKYNILLGNLPGNVDYFVSTGGSGGGAHATMLAATSNNSDFYAYEAACGAVGVYENEDGSYSTSVTIDGKDYEISDGLWGCVAYSAITSLAEGDMTMAFEYYLDTDYSFGSDFQATVAKYLSEEYMNYINEQNLSVKESEVGFDLNEDGDTEDTVELTIEYDESKYADTNGYGGTYLTLYLSEFISNLQWYVDNLDYGENWTWFNSDGSAMSDEEVAAMTTEDKALAFIEGRCATGTSGDSSGMPGGMGGGAPSGGMGGGAPSGDMASGMGGGAPSGDMASGMGGGAPSGSMPSGSKPDSSSDSSSESTGENADKEMVVGTPDEGTTQAAGSSTDSSNYSSYDEMLKAYQEDIEAVTAGDEFGNNQVELYNPLNYIGDEDTSDCTWSRILMGASEGDMSMFASLNLQIAWLNAGTDCNIEWQWDGGHVPSEILGESLALYVDRMYGKYVDGAAEVTKPEAEAQTANGTATEATATDISDWVTIDSDGNVSFTLTDAVSYRTSGASKAIPGFDVIDYGQEDYVFGNSETDARHWDS